MSEREQIQTDITDYLENDPYFSAPYGIIEGMRSVGKGKIREISFGVSRYLDATVEIWNPNKIVVTGQGGLSYKFEGTYSSKDALINHFKLETKYDEN